MSRLMRVTSAAAARIDSRSRSFASASRFSSRSRSAVSGERSWCEAFATNCVCDSMRSVNCTAMRLNVPATRRISSGPSVSSRRAPRSPRPSRSVACSRLRNGRVIPRAITAPSSTTAASTPRLSRLSWIHTSRTRSSSVAVGIGDTYRAVDDALAGGRNRCVRHDCVVRLELGAAGRARAPQRELHVVHACERPPVIGRLYRVEEDDAPRVDDDHVRTERTRGVVDRRGREGGVGFERVVDHGRDRVGPAVGVEQEAVVLTMRERDAEGNDEQRKRERGQRHVREYEPPRHRWSSSR